MTIKWERYSSRSYEYSGSDGAIEAVEVFDFVQDNLSDRRVAILDSGDIVYIWVGSRSKKADKWKAEKLARSVKHRFLITIISYFLSIGSTLILIPPTVRLTNREYKSRQWTEMRSQESSGQPSLRGEKDCGGTTGATGEADIIN